MRPPCWPVVPYALAGYGAGPGMLVGPWWWPLPLQQRGWWRALARAGADAHVWGRRHVPDVEVRSRVRLPWAELPAAPCPSRTRPGTGGSTRPVGRPGHGGATHTPPLSLAPCQPLSPTTQRVWRPPAARVVPAWVAEVGHWEARAPASGASNPTKACRRRLPASARPSLPLPAAPDAQR